MWPHRSTEGFNVTTFLIVIQPIIGDAAYFHGSIEQFLHGKSNGGAAETILLPPRFYGIAHSMANHETPSELRSSVYGK